MMILGLLVVTIFIYWRYQSALWYVKLYVMNVCTHTHTALYYKYIHCYYSSMVNCTIGECWCHDVTEGWIA